MATYIQNQPVFFGAGPACSSDELSISQIVDIDDINQFQFQLEVCRAQLEEEVIPDPNFSDPDNYLLGPGWSIAYNVLCLSGSSSAGTDVFTASAGFPLGVFTAGGYYQVQITVDSISVGGQIDVYIGDRLIGSITSTGTHTFYGFADLATLGGYPLVLVSPLDDTTICISEILAYEVLVNFVIGIYSSDGTFITSISLNSNPLYFSFVDDTVTVTINWQELGLTSGCYYLCLLDPCVNYNGQNYPMVILNQGLDSDGEGGTTDWNPSPLCWVSEATDVKGTSSGINDDLVQFAVFPLIGAFYTITVSVTGGTSISLDVYFGLGLVGTITAIGTHTISGICFGDNSLTLRLTSGTDVIVDNVAPVNGDGVTVPYVCDFTSNTFSYGDYSDGCSLLIRACNNENGLGFNFNGSGFAPSVRLPAKLKQAKYPEERITQEDSDGTKRVVYFTGRKAKNLAIDLQEEYIHDFVRLLGGFDNLFIDDVRYFVEDDEYEVDYGDSDNIGKSKILVSTRTQNVKNKNCSDTENDCIFDK